ncbi:hypothetical protein CRE_29137 [Caenorhabditis remanei]|uniref:Uncharacterized protein n=1 Tax=Caenorhabditis remanei TaxID=31234 RepID=E3N4K3_CAERE|nr:hypothetical protein CRE_29137 [Caenorhabditis remanei]
MHRIFENRRHPVAVKLLITNVEILRLTPGLWMQIEEMNIFAEADRVFSEMAPYIEESSYPLEKLHVFVYDSVIFKHLKLTSAKHIVFDRLDDDFDEVDGILSVDDFMILIKRWISSEKQEGASFSFALFSPETYDEIEMDEFHKNVFKKIKKTFKKSISGHRYAQIPTNHGTMLKVSVEPGGEEENPWNIVMQILS